ncbi:hypothetical protein C8R14_12916 [Nitrosomonas eutropha]|uniref:Uncharacterized protein n=1 Tax=Nitrosomonas eutropha TaxID=916 RepID=A0ABX5M5H1_9PROT|nr:hypothetical protein C8R14_12916 [Nitrosomonas eutropha]SEJ15918.1 hypothetical protein SAMN05216318_12816 [Nitrosomonas eutropha]
MGKRPIRARQKQAKKCGDLCATNEYFEFVFNVILITWIILTTLLEKLRDKITECKTIPAGRLSQGSSEFRKNSVQLLKTGVMNDDITSTFFPLFDYNIGAQPCRYIFLQA